MWNSTSQLVFEIFSFGFETCIEANSPLVNRLINDTLLNIQSNHVSIRHRFKSDKLVLSFQFYKEYQTVRWWDILVCIFMPKITIVWYNIAKLLYNKKGQFLCPAVYIDMISLYQLPALTAFALLASSFFATSCSVTFKHGSVCWHLLVVILLPCLVMPVKRPSRLGLGAPPSYESFISLFMNANQRRWRRLFINIHDTSVRHSSAVDNAINTSLSKTRQRQSDYFLLSASSALYVPCLRYTNTLPHWCDSDRNHRSLN